MRDTLFMIHGMWGGPWCFDNYRRFFESDFDCVVPALRYHRMTPADAPDPRLGTTGLLDYLDDLEKEIKKLPHKPVLLGHSMGGLLAQLLASRGLAKAVVLLAPAAPAGIWAIRPSVIRSFWSVQTRWGFWKTPMHLTFNEAAYAILGKLSPAEQRAAYDKFVFESGRAIFEIGYWFLDRHHASRVDESKISCPMLFVAAGDDKIVPAAVVRKTAQKYKKVASYKEYANHAHWLTAEPGWQDIASDIRQWLDAVQIAE